MQTKDSIQLVVLQTAVHPFLILNLHFNTIFIPSYTFFVVAKGQIFWDLLLTIKQKSVYANRRA